MIWPFSLMGRRRREERAIVEYARTKAPFGISGLDTMEATGIPFYRVYKRLNALSKRGVFDPPIDGLPEVIRGGYPKTFYRLCEHVENGGKW